MLPDVLYMKNTTTTLIYHDLQDGGHNKERRFKMEPTI
jgi:hypothetical protein